MCAGFKHQPDICKTWFDVNGGSITIDVTSKNFWVALIIFIVFLVVTVFLIFWFYKRKVKMEVEDNLHDQINEAVSKYFEM